MVMMISSTKFGVANQEQCVFVDQNSIILKKKCPPYLEMLFYMMVDIVTYIMLYPFSLWIPPVERWRSWEHGNTRAWLAGRMLWQGLVEACRVPHVEKPVHGSPAGAESRGTQGKYGGNEQKGRSDFKTTLVYWAQNSEERQVLQRKHDVEALAFTCLFCFGEPVLRALQQITDHARWIPQESQLILVSPRNSGGCPLYLGHVGVCREKTRRDSSCCLCNWANTTTLSFHSKSKWRSFSCLCWQLLRSRPPEYPDMQIRFWVWLN